MELLKHIFIYSLLVLATFNVSLAKGNKAYILNNSEKHDLYDYTYVIEHDASEIPFSAIVNGVYDSLFVPLESLTPDRIPADCWSKIVIQIPAGVSKEWVLYTGSIQNDYVDVFYESEGVFSELKKTGYYTPMTGNIVFEVDYNHLLINLPENETKNVDVCLYLRYNSFRFSTPELGVKLIDPKYFYKTEGRAIERSRFILGLVLGCILVLSVVALINFYFVRDKSFLYIAIAALNLVIYVFYCSGCMDLFIHFTEYNYFIIQLMSILIYVAYTLFVRHFVLLEKLSRGWVILINSTFLLCAINFAGTAFSFCFYDKTPSYLIFDWIIAPTKTFIYILVTFRLLLAKNKYSQIIAIGNALAAVLIFAYFFIYIVFNIDLIFLLITMLTLNILFFLVAFIYRLWSIQSSKQYFQIAELDRSEEKLAKVMLENERLKKKLNKLNL